MRPTDKELAELLRRAEERLRILSGGVKKGFGDMVLSSECGKAAHALDVEAGRVSAAGDAHIGCGGKWLLVDGFYGLLDRCDKCGEERA